MNRWPIIANLPAAFGRTLSEFGLAPFISSILTWIVIGPRLVPLRFSDRGVFVSVAERLLAGDTLYTDVYDNKDPLFYYFVAGQRFLGTQAELLAEITLLLVAATSTYLIASRWAPKNASFTIGFISTPIILTGVFYYPGYTHLPAISLCLASYALSLKGRWAFSGVVVGILFFSKLIMVPLALCLVASAILSEYRGSVLRFIIALLVTLSCGVAILLERSELWPWMETLTSNFRYSHGVLINSTSLGDVPFSHWTRISAPNLTVALLSIISGTLVVYLTNPDRALRIAIATTGITLALALVILTTTGMWPHHNQVLYLPAVLSAICLSSLLGASLYGNSIPTLLLVVSVSLLLGGTTDLAPYTNDPVEMVRLEVSLLDAPPTESRRLLAIGTSGSYARLGQNDDEGHAIGLSNWKLACPEFNQYPFEPAQNLNKVLDCVRSVPTLIVARSLAEEPGRPIWNDFVADVEDLLRSSYHCDAATGLRICQLSRNDQHELR
jgi:hypothetical protein